VTAVSVLVRTIGRQVALKDALDSLLAQTLTDFEVVVVEDGPGTLANFLKFYDRLTIRYDALGSMLGRSTAGNRAMELARGQYCLFLDEDDLLYPDHLKSLVETARAGGRAVVYSWSEERSVDRAPDGSITRRGRLKRYRRETFSLLQLVAGNFLPINAVLFERALFTKAGGFDADIDCLEDWLLWLRYAAMAPDWQCVPRVTAVYHAPLDKRARRKAFGQWHAKVNERMRTIFLTCPVQMLHRDMKRHFFMAIFLRKLYYHVTGFIRWS